MPAITDLKFLETFPHSLLIIQVFPSLEIMKHLKVVVMGVGGFGSGDDGKKSCNYSVPLEAPQGLILSCHRLSFMETQLCLAS